MGPEVRLVDLDVIKRYSLAVRQESVPAEELLTALDASRDAVLAALGRTPKSRAKPKPKPRTPSTRAPKAT
jgi:hypothetical protein